MKLSVVTILAASFAVTAAFAPAARNVPGGAATAKTTDLRGAVSGEDVRHARPKFAPGHFETQGAKSSAGREQISGEDVRHARPKFAPGHFETQGAKSSAGREQISGEDVRHARPKFAPFAPSFESGPAKAYGLGGGTKKAAGTSTGTASGYLGNL